MASDPITSGKIGEEKVEAMTDFFPLGSKIPVDDDFSHEIRRSLFPGRKAMTNLASVAKSRNSTFLIKVHVLISKAVVFTLVMYGCERWTIKNAERQRTYALQLWCWRRFLRVLWTARRSNQSVLKEINPEYSLEGLMLKLKLQYFGQTLRASGWQESLVYCSPWGHNE